MSAIGHAHPVVGTLAPFAEELSPMFQAFRTGMIHGLAMNPGHGEFARFLDECQKNYDTIGIWEIWNRSLASYLKRRGFREVREELDGDLAEGMRWDKAVQS